MTEVALTVEARDAAGKGVARKLRATGRIPAVLYGVDTKTQSLSVDAKEIINLLRHSESGLNTLINLKIAGEKGAAKTVMVRDLQRDPVSGAALHADFYVIDLKQTIRVSVPVQLVGTPVGVRLNDGLLEHLIHEVEIDCLPNAIPEHLDVDVTELDIEQMLHVNDIVLPEGAVMHTDAEVAVAAVHAKRAVQEEAEEVEAPETIVGEAAAAPAEGEAE